MEQSFLRKFGLLLLFGLAGALVFGLVYDYVAPLASVDLQYSRRDIMDRGRWFLVGLGYDLKDYQEDATFQFDGHTHLFLQGLFGMKRTNEIIRRDSLSTHFWDLTWYDRSVTRSQRPEAFSVWMSPGGRILGFEHVIRDTVTKRSITAAEAEQLARDFLRRQRISFSEYVLKTSVDTRRPGRIDYRFVFEKEDTLARDAIWVRVQGDEVGGFRRDYAPGEAFQSVFSGIDTTATFMVTGSVVGLFLLFFFVVILFLTKYHEGEVNTRTAVMLFAGLFTVSALSVILAYPTLDIGVQMGDMNPANLRIVMLIFYLLVVELFLSVMAFAAWSVGESASRTTWPEKMRGMDSALFRKYFTVDVGEGVLRGYAWGLILLGGYSGILYLLMPVFKMGLFTMNVNSVPEAYLPGLRPLLSAASVALFSEVIYRLFFVSYLKEKTRKVWTGVLISSLLWMVTAFALWDTPFGYLRLDLSYLARFLFGLLFCFLFLKYDLLTTIVANFVMSALAYAIPLFTSSAAWYEISLWVFLGLLALPVLLAIKAYSSRRRFEFTPDTLPPHIRRITERERMAKELEIARRVQMSLLPKTNPLLPGYDIAGICVPALEVGGDYYDFVNLGEKKLGIAIGDVSGKGVPAAIYMTLTKGILQSHAEEHVSPKLVLTKVNSLMYRTIDRNSFVSMFYAILDVKARRIRFSRAGQCPLILTRRSGEKGAFLSPKGMALGLEMGSVFESVLEEEELRLQSGQVLVFYTDGFTEARNAHGEEFAESRLVESIAHHWEKSAQGIIDSVCRDVQFFIGATPAHDDMTMVVIKVA
jgi:sigma-B regulation protein RsbU (phosphoserine phosphatase)